MSHRASRQPPHVPNILHRTSRRKPIFSPWIRGIRIATQFPKTEDIAIQKCDLANEFRAFPRVELWNDDARWAAMIGGEWLTGPFMRDQDIIIHAGVQRRVSRVTVVTFKKDTGRLGLRLDDLCNRKERHPFPFHVKLAPGGNTMKVAHIFELRQGQKLLPSQSDRVLDFAMDLQFPLIERNLGPNAEIKHRKV